MITKGGIEAVTRSLANEYAKEHIRFNAVARGIVDTPMHTNRSKAFLRTLSPMSTISSVGDIADAVVYLTEARNITGGSAARGRRCAPGPLVSRMSPTTLRLQRHYSNELKIKMPAVTTIRRKCPQDVIVNLRGAYCLASCRRRLEPAACCVTVQRSARTAGCKCE